MIATTSRSRAPARARSPRGPSAALALALALGLALAAPPVAAGDRPAVPDTLEAWAGPLAVETLAAGLSYPWSAVVLPDGDLLVSEKHPGSLRRAAPDGTISAPIAGVPAVVAEANGGLLGLALDPAFDANRRVYMAYAEAGAGDTAGLAVARGVLAGDRLEAVETIFRQTPKVPGRQNYGGRLVFAPDGSLFVLAGERFAPAAARDPTTTIGKVVRIRPDGTVPADNPFAGVDGADPTVWSIGHRNPGGGAIHPRTGRLYVAEFGPRGGDELNVARAGGDFGWPDASWGVHYSGEDIPDPPTRPDLDPAIFFWTPTIGPSGMAFYRGEGPAAVPEWAGSLLVGALTRKALVRLTLGHGRVLSEERLPVGVRVRDVLEAPDGAILLLTDERRGRILRIAPARTDEPGKE